MSQRQSLDTVDEQQGSQQKKSQKTKDNFYRGRKDSGDGSIKVLDIHDKELGQESKGQSGIYPVEQQLSRHASQYMQQSQRLTKSGKIHQDEEDETYKSNIKVAPIALYWEDLKYEVFPKKSIFKKQDDKPQSKIILNNLSGVILAGQLSAIMGPTGCGKTSVLNTLAGRLPTGGKVSGKIFVNGEPREDDFIKHSAYVLQDDVLFKTLTVEETFQISATLRLPRTMSRKDKFKVADQIINELGLSKVRKTYVGDAFFRGVSGGERKRVNIGNEMMGNPSVMFLDEPTSGLDSFQALSVMKTLWNLSRRGRNVCAVIHQPRSQIYEMFDTLYLLSEGRVIYFGNAQKADDYFARQGFPTPKTYNPSDFFLDIISMDYRSAELEADSRKRIKLLADNYFQDPQQKEQMEMYKSKALQYPALEKKGKGIQFKRNTIFTEFVILTWRAFTQGTRDWSPFVALLMQNVVISLIIGAIYHKNTYDAVGFQNRIGLLFFVIINISFSQLFGTLSSFPTEKNMINKERASNMYRSISYYFGKIIAEVPIKSIPLVVFSCCIYYLARFNPFVERFFRFMAFAILTGLCGQAIGYFASAGFKTQAIPQQLAPALNVVFLLYGGYFLSGVNLPRGSFWVKYVTPQFYAWSGMVKNELDDSRIFYTLSSNCNGQQQSQTITAKQLLDGGFDPRVETGISIWVSYLLLIVLIVTLHSLAALILTFTKQKFAPLKVEQNTAKGQQDTNGKHKLNGQSTQANGTIDKEGNGGNNHNGVDGYHNENKNGNHSNGESNNNGNHSNGETNNNGASHNNTNDNQISKAAADTKV